MRRGCVACVPTGRHGVEEGQGGRREGRRCDSVFVSHNGRDTAQGLTRQLATAALRAADEG